MNAERFNLHATAIVVDNTGILFTGPSGSGKSELAFSFLTEAQRCGLPAALIADDQIFVYRDGENIIAERPEAIAGLLELRGSGIVNVNSVPSAGLNFAVTTVLSPENPRLPEDDEVLLLPCGGHLPLLRIQLSSLTPYGKFAALAQNLFKTNVK
ncbi:MULTISPECIES: HPr kinase/phosphorylase [Agrobacterium]|uniref:HPr kinase/phosphorylase n=1 Tax=Agrobacterium TaxID=357 RepID=UPI002784AC97|nr:HPr kinase/phosphorylase [Agrobacterium sp. SORGH_AS_0745]MDP9761556.1 serine kinase of HPr protein (carbohydrate metabolism regulator) [Agrobacterium tumefaciens]MDQ1221152.1 serine kinase of HPr protein (carbohydrate metabolism regulator) [Agrobacterium sp. SORGH_AS_0745]